MEKIKVYIEISDTRIKNENNNFISVTKYSINGKNNSLSIYPAKYATQQEIFQRIGKRIGELVEEKKLPNYNEVLNIGSVSARKIVKCKDPMVCLRGCSVHEQTCKHPIYES